MSLAADARAELESWRAPDGGQEQLRRTMLRHLAAYPDAMRRTCVPGHLTASAAILDPAGRATVLTLHAKAGLWLQTGGHCEDGDATLQEAALREAREESGIADLRILPGPVQLDVHPVAFCAGGTQHLDVRYAVVAPEGAALQADPGESADLAWFGVDALPEKTDHSVTTLVAAASAAVRTAA